MVKSVGVIGGGLMGGGIAQIFAAAGGRVAVVESDADAASAAHSRIRAGLHKAVELGKLADAAEALSRISLLTRIADLPGDADLVVEAVPEIPEVKIQVLTAAEAVVSDDTILASNTSSLSIVELGAALRRPERFLGMHFFNPVPASKLVEVVTAPQTAQPVLHSVVQAIRALGKTDIVVRDSPGFATSRLGVMLGLEAIRMLEEGVADAESIDRAMELGYRHPMGPLRSTDLVGLDVRLAIAEYLHSTLGDRFAPPQLLRDKVAEGSLGRKTGRGFYDWP
ncbi:MAG: 3-hydroxybutyryl-CoA dehydrogenase [Streptosporangiaceae bacterium]|nr:3-hydroxybutyryl-CoA dehydrogenase [Streptosporangiaceae bacterium]